MSIISALIILPFSFTANSALSATTAKVIEGTAPYLTTTLTDEIKSGSFRLLGFGFEDKEYYAADLSKLYIDPTKYSPASLTSAITGVVKSPAATEASDDDGDGNFGLSAKTALTVSVKIYNDSNNEITSTSTFSELLCSSTASKPYTAKIKIAGDLSLTTEYGIPRNKDYTDSTPETNTQPSKEYEVPISAICNLRPASMHVYTGTANVNIKYADGYNSATWESGTYSGSIADNARIQTGGGFKVDSGFPTTGFDKAVFSIIGSGNDQKDYKCEWESGGNWVTYSANAASTSLGAGCKITYNSPTGKPSSPITIKMSYKGTKVDSFTIPVPTKWAIGKGALTYSNTASLSTSSTFYVLNTCRTVGSNKDDGTTTRAEGAGTSDTNKAFRQKYLYRRDELTNTPRADRTKFPEGGSLVYMITYFTRDADGTFMGEWGRLYDYADSGWRSSSWCWTSEAWSTDNQFHVGFGGNVYGYSPINITGAICRGE